MYTISAEVEPKPEKIYTEALRILNAIKVPFLVGGGVAMDYYTSYRDTLRDLDIFCKAGDYPKLLKALQKEKFKTVVADDKWLAKASKSNVQIDLLFSTTNGIHVVDDTWIKNGRPAELFFEKIKLLAPEDLFWCKIYVQNRKHYDGPDLNHLVLKMGDNLDWKYILQRMEAHWELLLAALVNYRFIFPSEREKVPKWLMKELIDRQRRQLETALPQEKTCRGPLVSREDYDIDVREKGFIV